MKHRYQGFHGHRQMRTLLISTYEMGRQPFGLASPAAWLRHAGVDVTCLDLSRQPFRDELASVDFVAFHLPMHTATRLAVPVIRRVRELNPDATLCCYGLYAPLNQEVLSRLGVEAILGGEFEADLLALATGHISFSWCSMVVALNCVYLFLKPALCADRGSNTGPSK